MDLPKRKLPRLSGYDYSKSNYCFVTICTDERKNLFGSMEDLNNLGIIAERNLLEIGKHYDNVFIDKYIIMPNHIHAIIVIRKDKTERSRPFPAVGGRL